MFFPGAIPVTDLICKANQQLSRHLSNERKKAQCKGYSMRMRALRNPWANFFLCHSPLSSGRELCFLLSGTCNCKMRDRLQPKSSFALESQNFKQTLVTLLTTKMLAGKHNFQNISWGALIHACQGRHMRSDHIRRTNRDATDHASSNRHLMLSGCWPN